MTTKEEIKCKLGLHIYEIIKEEVIKNVRGDVIGKIIVLKCSRCGRIKTNKYNVVENF